LAIGTVSLFYSSVPFNSFTAVYKQVHTHIDIIHWSRLERKQEHDDDYPCQMNPSTRRLIFTCLRFPLHSLWNLLSFVCIYKFHNPFTTQSSSLLLETKFLHNFYKLHTEFLLHSRFNFGINYRPKLKPELTSNMLTNSRRRSYMRKEDMPKLI